jgi:hypothetical protein
MRSPCIGGPIPPSKPKIQNTHKNIWLFEPKSLNLGVWLFEIGATVEFSGPSYGGVQYHHQGLKFKTLNSNGSSLSQISYIDVWWFRIGARMQNFEVPHTFRVQFHLRNLKLQMPTNKFSFFKQNRLNLEVWWFEIRALVKFWGPQNVGGPIPPSNPQIANTHQQILTL